MAIKITRKNGGLNRAVGGFAAAFPQALALGMQARQNAAQEENRRQLTALAVQQAKQVSDQLDRELAQQTAESEAVGTVAQDYANSPTAPLNAGMKAGPGVAAAVGTAQQDKWGKLGEIAKRMDPKAARLFLEDVRQRETQAVKERGLASFRDKIARIESEGAMVSDPEARPWMDPALLAEGDAKKSATLKNLAMMAADPNADPVLLDQKLGELIRESAKAEGAAYGRADAFRGMQQQAEAAAAASGGMFAPEQGRAIRTMMSAFRQSPTLYDDPEAMRKFQAKFQDALQGYTTVGNERVRFEDEPAFRKLALQNMELKNRLLQSQTASEQAQGRYYDAGAQGKLTPKALTPTQTGAMTDAQRQNAIADLEKIAVDPMTGPEDRARIMQRIQALEGGVPAMLQDVQERMGVRPQDGIVPPAAMEPDISKAIEELRKITDPVKREEAMRRKAKELAGGR